MNTAGRGRGGGEGNGREGSERQLGELKYADGEMFVCAKAWRKERPGAQGRREAGERPQEPQWRTPRNPCPTETPPEWKVNSRARDAGLGGESRGTCL